MKRKLQVDCIRNLAYIEAVLELACITSHRSVSYELVNMPQEEEVCDLFHKLRVHNSHKAATHFGLNIYFCTRCGHYGQPSRKSIGLARHCVAPTRQGSQALRNILRGKWPTYIGSKVANRVPKIPSNMMDDILIDNQ